MSPDGDADGGRRFSVETRTEDGWTLRGEAIVPDAPLAAAVLGHAMMVDRRTMDRPRGHGLASCLADAGIAVLNFDLRGHGESGPRAEDGATFTYDDFVQQDVPAIVRAGRARFPGLPIAVVGHSLAGHAAMISAGLRPDAAPDGIVAIAANLWAPRFEPSARAKLKKGIALGAWAAVTAPLGRFDSRAFRMGSEAEPWPYVREFLRFWRSDALMSEDGRSDFLLALSEADLEVLAISSEGDRLLARPASVARFLGTMWRARVTHRVVGRDDAAKPDHMGLVIDPASRSIWEEIATWVLSLQSKLAR